MLISFALISCSSSENHADYEKNLEIAKKFISLHSSEDWEAQAELIHDDLSWSQPVYGSENYGKEGHIEAMKMYQSMFDNIKFDADYWLAGVDPETGEIDAKYKEPADVTLLPDDFEEAMYKVAEKADSYGADYIYIYDHLSISSSSLL